MSDETSIMTIQDVFDKHRNPLRSLNTIVKVSDTSTKNIWTEFEEFVVTETLLDYFLEFYNAFSTSISFDEPKMPFWLEGFYGSGKSHFAKVLGYLFQDSSLTNGEGNEWSSIDFFIEYILKPAKFDDGRAKKAKTELIKGLEIYSK